MKLTELKVALLKEELEKRSLEKTGVKDALQKRLQQALKDEGHDPDEYCFNSDSNEVSPNESQDAKVNGNGEAEDEEPVGEDTKGNEKEQIVMTNKENTKESSAKGKGASPSKSLSRPDSVTSKDNIELASSLKPSSDDGSLTVNIDDQSVRDESFSQNGNVEDDKTEEQTGESSPAKKTEDSTAKSSHSESTAGTEGKDKKPSNQNLWVSGLDSKTRATDLKQIFSTYGKVTGAKVVTNVKAPGSRCYGFVTMASPEEASRCIQHLHRTELHGRMMSVERAKVDPAISRKKKGEKKEMDKSDFKEEAAATEKGKERRRPIDNRHGSNRNEESKRDRPAQRENKDVLTFDKIKEERERHKIREQERQAREESRRRWEERERERERERRRRDEKNRIERERRDLQKERQRLDKEKMELLRIQKEQTRIERKQIEREKEQLLREHRRLSDPKRNRSPDHGYDDRKRFRYNGGSDSLTSREKQEYILKIQREKEKLLGQRLSDSRRVVERSRLDRYNDEAVPGRWPPNEGPPRAVPKAPALHHAAFGVGRRGAYASWSGRLGAGAPAMGRGAWGPFTRVPPQSQMIMPHHGMSVGPDYGSLRPKFFPTLPRY